MKTMAMLLVVLCAALVSCKDKELSAKLDKTTLDIQVQIEELSRLNSELDASNKILHTQVAQLKTQAADLDKRVLVCDSLTASVSEITQRVTILADAVTAGRDEIVARRILLMDGEKARIEIGFVDGTPAIRLSDRDENPVIAMAVSKDEAPFLAMYEKGTQRVMISSVQGNASMFVSDGQGTARVMVAAPRDGTPFVALSDVNGRLRAELSASDTIGLRFLDEKGKVAAGFFESAGDAYIAILKGDRIKWTAP